MAEPRPAELLRKVLSTVGLATGVVLALWLTRGAWGSRFPAGGDTIGHLVRAQWGLRLFEHGRANGWDPRFGVGIETYLVYPPGFDVVVGLIRLATLGLLSTVGAIKAIEILVVVALVPAGWYLARSFGLDDAAAGTVAGLILGVDSFFGVGFQAMFGVGLVPDQMAAPLWCVALGALWRISGPASSRRDVGVGVAASAALIVVHPISALALAVLLPWGIVLRALHGTLGWRQLALLAGTVLTAGALAGFWAVPFLVHRSLGGGTAQYPIASWSSQLGDIVRGHLLFGPYLGAFVVASIVAALVVSGAGRRNLVGPPADAALLTIALFASIHAIKHWAPNSNAGLILGDRALGEIGMLAVIPLGWWCAKAVDAIGFDRTAAAIGGAALAVILVGASYHWHQQGVQAGTPTAAFATANATLRRVVPPQGRVAVERTFAEKGVTGVDQPNLWVAELSGRNVLNVFVVETSSSMSLGYTAEDIATANPVVMDARLSRLGVTDVLTIDQATASRYTASGLFDRLWSDGELSILTVVPPPGQPPPATMLSVARSAGPLQVVGPGASVEHPRWRLSLPRAESVTVALGWNPAWHVTLDGRAIPLGRDPDEPLVRVVVPAGSHFLALDYRGDAWASVGWLVTIVALATLVAAVVVAPIRRATISGPLR